MTRRKLRVPAGVVIPAVTVAVGARPSASPATRAKRCASALAFTFVEPARCPTDALVKRRWLISAFPGSTAQYWRPAHRGAVGRWVKRSAQPTSGAVAVEDPEHLPRRSLSALGRAARTSYRG